MKKLYILLIAIFTLSVAESSAQAQCQANFQVTASNLTVQFFDLSTSSSQIGGNFSYFWDFGNGVTSTQQNPTHTYSSAGTYLVCLSIYDSIANCSDSICSYLTIASSQPTPCMVSYTYSANSSNTVAFSSTVTSGTAPFVYAWDFGDGSATGTTANPTHTYASSGGYGVTLTITDSFGSTCSYYDTVYVNYCNSYFTYNIGSNGSVSFMNQSTPTGQFVASSWNFGDGTGSGMTNPNHTYTSSGTYIVTLNIYDSTSNCSSSYTDSVAVQLGTPTGNCNASYTIAKDSSVAFGVILYNNSSNFNSHFYLWDFGDGTTGSGRTPIHQYQSFGSYIVCLTITDSLLNCTSTFCDTVGMDSLGNLKAGFGIEVRDISVGIEEIDQLNAAKVFPNPATSEISLDLRFVKSTVRVKIIDLTGKVVFEETNQTVGNIEKFDLSGFNNGLYFIVLDDGNTQKIEKFIKK